MRVIVKYLCFVFIVLNYALGINAQCVEIDIIGIRSLEGQFIIEVFKDNNSFKEEKPFQRKVFIKNGIKESRMTVMMELRAGTFGLALIDDENSNMEMDYRKIGLTKEGFAFSNFYLKGLKKPDFSDFEFAVEENRPQKIIMKIRYM